MLRGAVRGTSAADSHRCRTLWWSRPNCTRRTVSEGTGALADTQTADHRVGWRHIMAMGGRVQPACTRTAGDCSAPPYEHPRHRHGLAAASEHAWQQPGAKGPYAWLLLTGCGVAWNRCRLLAASGHCTRRFAAGSTHDDGALLQGAAALLPPRATSMYAARRRACSPRPPGRNALPATKP